MRQPTIRERKRGNKVTYICDIDGKQFGLGNDPEAAKVRFAELLAKQGARQELTAQIEVPATSALTVRAVLSQFLDWSERHHAPNTIRFNRQPIIGNKKPNSKAKLTKD